MTKYISILRGINVGGHRKILMKDLEKLYAGLGFKDIKTFIQSGNVVFHAADTRSETEVTAAISNMIRENFQFEVPVILRTVDDLQKVLKNNPFLSEPSISIEKLHVTFLSAVPGKERSAGLIAIDFSPDRFVIMGRDVYLHCPGSYAETKLSNTLFEKKLNVSATTRNWNTVNKLAEIASAMPHDMH